MTEDIRRLRKEIELLDVSLKAKREQLQQIVDKCSHNWSEHRYTPEHYEGYTIPGDPPGTMGSDWRGPTYVEPKTVKKWTRECLVCGEVQTTTDTKPGDPVPHFRS